MRNRDGETGPLPFRTGRYFTIGANWYFATREQVDKGPFHTKEEAEMGLRDYLRVQARKHKTTYIHKAFA